LWTRAVQPPLSHVPTPPAHLRPLVAADALAWYLKILVVPGGLTIDPGRRPDVVLKSGRAYWTWVVPAVAAAAVVLLTIRVRRKGWPVSQVDRLKSADAGPDVDPEVWRVLPAAAIFFVIPIVPVLGLVPFDFQQYSTVAEHYLYPAMVGAALLVAALIELARRARPLSRWPVGLAAGVLVVLAVRSHVQTYHWRDNVSLFSHAVAVNPSSYAAHNSLAAALMQGGRLGDAEAHARRAIELMPENAQARVTLGSILSAKGELGGAAEEYRAALALSPRDAFIHNNLAGVLARRGDVAGARKHLETALSIDPDDAQAHLNLGTLLAQTDQVDAAIGELRTAVRLAPHSFIGHTNLGYLLLEKGDPQQALGHFEQAVKLNPNHPPAREGLEAARQLRPRNR
jgi:Flp pilus assembly protein TadD